MKPQLIAALIFALTATYWGSVTGGPLEAQTPSGPSSAPAAAAAPPAPLPTPAMVGPLSTALPTAFDAGRYFGTLQVTGILSGIAYVQDNHNSSDHAMYADVSNAQVFVQKTSGVLQFYIQGGA